MSCFWGEFLGTRGSVSADGEEFFEFGGATSCVMLSVGDTKIVLDAGSGILKMPKSMGDGSAHILISHPHIDHILGLPLCAMLYEKERKVHIYGAKRDGMDVQEQIDRLMAPPLWPVGTEAFSADVHFHDIKEPFEIDDAEITFMEGAHPGGSTIYKIEYFGKSVVYATDYEPSQQTDGQLIAFSKDCSMLIIDGQYTPEQLTYRKGYGHASYMQAMEIAQKANAKQMRIFHHSPFHNDEMLKKQEKRMQQIMCNSAFARQKERFILCGM